MMKMLITLFSLLLIASAFAANSPFSPSEEKRFQALESNFSAKARLAIGSSALASGDSLNIGSLPPKSVIHNVRIFVEEQIESASDNTIALGCESSGDLLSAIDLTDTASGNILWGTQESYASGSTTFLVAEDGCALSVDVGAGVTGITDGRLLFLLEYFTYQ